MEKSQRYDLGSLSPIHEIAARSDDNSLIIGVRNKNHLTVLKLKEGTEETLLNFESKSSYVSLDLSENLCLASINIDKHLKIYDLTTNKTVNKYKLEYINSLIPDNWSCVRSYQASNYIYADRQNIRVIDARTKVVSSPFKLNQYGEYCETISCLSPSKKYENLIYASSSHKLFAIDLRNFSGDIQEKDMVLQWPVQMNLPPIMIKTCPLIDSELVLTSSNLPSDSRVMVTTNGSDYKSSYLPIRLPSMNDTYNVCKDYAKCLYPVSSIHQRMKICITGLDFVINKKGKISIVSQNSICDLFKQDLVSERKNVPTDISKKFEKWMNSLNQIENSSPNHGSFGATAVFNRKDLLNVLTNKNICKATVTEKELESARPKQRSKWQRSPALLSQYKDALVESIMDIWNLQTDNDITESVLPLSSNVQQTFEEKINYWLEKNEFTINENNQSDTRMEVEEEVDYSQFEKSVHNNIAQISTQQDNHVKEPIMETNITQRESPACKVTSNKIKRKKQHVMGF